MTDTAVAISERRSIHPVLWGFLIVFFYFFVWFIQRIPSIVNNTLWHEDYALLVSDQYQVVPGHEYTYLRSYRPLFYLEYHIIEFIYPGHLGTVVPKILGGFYLAITGLITSTLLKKWKAQPVAAFLIPLFFLCHPVLNEISIWNVAHYNSLVVLLLVAGVALWDEFSSRWRQVLGSLIILLGTLGYPIYLTIPVILFITEYTLKRLNGLHFSFRQLTWKLGIIVMITGLFFISAEITRTYMKSHHMPYDNRTFSLWNFVSASPSFLALKFREVRRIYMNLFLPIFSFYLGLGKALKVWKIIPISLALAMLIVARLSRLNPLYAIVMALIPFLPGLAHMTINSVQTEWRMSVPGVYAAAISLTPLLTIILSDRSRFFNRYSKILRLAIIIVFTIFATTAMAIVTWGDSELRVDGNRQDLEVLNQIETFWKTQDLNRQQFEIGSQLWVGQKKIDRNTPKVVTEGSSIFAGYTEFTHGWSRRTFVAYSGFRPFDEKLNMNLYRTMVDRCHAEGVPIHNGSGYRVYHSIEERLSFICR